MTETARLALPLLEPGQAQKELFHNEALLLLDAAVQPVVETVGRDAPPPGPHVPGACHAVGVAPTGEWAGRAGAIACWTAGGWRFVAARPGMQAWHAGEGRLVRLGADGWRGGAAVAAPAGGATVDAEARAAISALLATLRAQGLVAP